MSYELHSYKEFKAAPISSNATERLCTKSGFQSALSGRMTIAQQFTAGLDGREDVVREADD
jgi:hypothetical protein